MFIIQMIALPRRVSTACTDGLMLKEERKYPKMASLMVRFSRHTFFSVPPALFTTPMTISLSIDSEYCNIHPWRIPFPPCSFSVSIASFFYIHILHINLGGNVFQIPWVICGRRDKL